MYNKLCFYYSINSYNSLFYKEQDTLLKRSNYGIKRYSFSAYEKIQDHFLLLCLLILNNIGIFSKSEFIILVCLFAMFYPYLSNL